MELSKTIPLIGLLMLAQSMSVAAPPTTGMKTNQTSTRNADKTKEPEPIRTIRTRATIASELMRSGDQLLRSDQVRSACNAYQKAHDALPTWWMPRLAIVRCGRITGVPNARLLQHAEYAVKARPQIAITHTEYGAVLEEAGRKAEAAKAYQAALRIDVRRFDARIRLGILLADLGQYKAAKRHLETIVRFRPREMRVLLALAQSHEGLGELNKAERTYQKIAQKTLYPAQGLARLIQFYERHGMDKKSSKAKKRFSTRFPSQ